MIILHVINIWFYVCISGESRDLFVSLPLRVLLWWELLTTGGWWLDVGGRNGQQLGGLVRGGVIAVLVSWMT